MVAGFISFRRLQLASGASASARSASSRRRRVSAVGGEARLQLVAERHQRIDLGNDAVLFGEDVERAEPPSKLRN